jgi:tetratricopeptide (TPR) repeat protein
VRRRWPPPACLGLAALLIAASPSRAQVTFNKHIAPIVFEYCSGCHHAGEAAPFTLMNYDDVRKHASQIAAVTKIRFMPPWPPAHGYGDFVGERRLSDAQIRLIQQWVAEGKKEGDPRDLPPAPHFDEDGWRLGPPDLIVKFPQPFHVPATGADVWRNFVMPTGLAETKYVRAIQLRPGNKRVVHHANIVLDSTHSLRRRDGADGQPGFPGMDVITEARSGSFDPTSHFLFWKPGAIPEFLPEDMAWKLDPGTDLIFNLHLLPTGKDEVVQPELGLYFTTRAPTRLPMLVQLEHDGALDLPPGVRDFEVRDRVVLPAAAEVLGVYPHAHYLGKQMEAWATLPNGSRIWLLKINDWDVNWQGVYMYRKPVSLPKGSALEMRITYDNSAQNPRNPSHPPQRVMGGNRSSDEMGHIWLQLVAPVGAKEDIRPAIEEAVMKRRLEKYPADFVAHYNLGAMFVSRGEFAAAIPYLEAALKVDPHDATARNTLGGALLENDRLDDALRELHQAVADDPGYLNARFNLGRALAANGDLAAAAAEFSAIIEKTADDGDAQWALATVMMKQRQYAQALPHLEIAARLKPNDADIQTNLGVVLAMQSDFAGAIRAFERALEINPNEGVAKQNLERARKQLESSGSGPRTR